MCPFCYIGKRHLETAINALPFHKEIDIEWKSYQLNPEYHNPGKESTYAYLARAKGMPLEQAKQLTGNVADMARAAGLTLAFDHSVPANSFDAHRLIHLAKAKNIQNEAEEALFEAHFTAGADIADHEVLIRIGVGLGMNAAEIEEMLDSDAYAEAVRYDIYESQQIGIRGVPYFVFDRKYALSGAQPVETFTAAITQSFKEWKASQPDIPIKPLNDQHDLACEDNECTV